MILSDISVRRPVFAAVLSLLLIAFYRGLASNVLKVTGKPPLYALSAGAVIISLTALGMVDGTYYHPQSTFYLAIAFAAWSSKPRENLGE